MCVTALDRKARIAVFSCQATVEQTFSVHSLPFITFRVSIFFFYLFSYRFNPFRFFHFATNLLRLTVPFFHKPLCSSCIWRYKMRQYGIFLSLESSCLRQGVTQRILRNVGTTLSLSLSLSLSPCYFITSISKVAHWGYNCSVFLCDSCSKHYSLLQI